MKELYYYLIGLIEPWTVDDVQFEVKSQQVILLPFSRHKEHRREKIETNKERLWKSKENMIASLK